MVREGGVAVPLAGPVDVNGVTACQGVMVCSITLTVVVRWLTCVNKGIYPIVFFLGGEGRVCDK